MRENKTKLNLKFVSPIKQVILTPFGKKPHENERDHLRSTTADVHFNGRKTLGWKIRDFVGSIEKAVGPYFKKVFPNFVAVHYFYIVSMIILASIMMYPVKTERYIDILFFASGAATQAGLNTVDVNKLSLYQQAVIYMTCLLTTPIFIHSSVCFLRLYWFERHFDNIRETSKQNFQMRRTQTLMARTQSMDQNTRNNTIENIAQSSMKYLNEHEFPFPRIHKRKQSSRNNSTTEQHENNAATNSQNNFLHPNSNGNNSPDSKSSYENSVSSDNQPKFYTQSEQDLFRNNNQVDHISEPSSSQENLNSNSDLNLNSQNKDNQQHEDNYQHHDEENVKFAELPKPKRKIEPRDVYMSLSMMRDKVPDEENQGPALVIKGPAEREKNQAIKFDLGEKPKRRKKLKTGRKPSFSGFRFTKKGKEEDTGEEEHDGNADRSGDEELSPDENEADHSGMQYIKRTPSISRPIKPVKRANTLDFIKKQPTFEKILKNKLKRRFSSFAIADEDDDDNHDDGHSEYSSIDSESDDEEDDHEAEAANSLQRHMSTNYLSWRPTIGRNSTFVNLTEEQKEELGGVEYRSLKLLSKILVFYYIGFNILAVLFLIPWIWKTLRYETVLRDASINNTWWGFFTSMSAFSDLGLTLTPDSMSSFNKSIYVLVICSFFIIIGNTGFPILLRFIIWVLFKFSKDLSLFKESLGFLLDHPRRCFTLLFPSAPTWWLFFILVLFNAIDLVLFIVLDLDAEAVKSLPVNYRVLDGFFQAVSTRTAGFTCVDLSLLHPAVQVSYTVMMYISVLPLAISIRRTNVYEEQSLGVYMGNSDNVDNGEIDQNATSYIGAHLRKQLSFDLWFVFLGLFIICIAEGSKIKDEALPDFSVFSVMFEVVSAYGTVGLSLGYPNTNTSFSGQFSVISKLVIIMMMIRGRHRGLPYSLDRAIILPSDKMEERDRYQSIHANNRFERAETVGSSTDPVITFLKSAAPDVITSRLRKPSFMRSRSRSHHSRQSLSSDSGRPFRDVHFDHSNNTTATVNNDDDHANSSGDNHYNSSGVNHYNNSSGSNHYNNHDEAIEDIELDDISKHDEEASPFEGVYRAETYGGVRQGELEPVSRDNSIYTC